MSIDEAIKQLSFHKLKGAEIIKEVLLNNFKYRSIKITKFYSIDAIRSSRNGCKRAQHRIQIKHVGL